MGNYSSSKPKSAPLPTINVSEQMNYIVYHWLRMNNFVDQMPPELIQLIVNQYSYQLIFDTEHLNKLKKLQDNKPKKQKQKIKSKCTTFPQISDGSSDCPYLFKLILIGDAGVGKSSYFRRYFDDYFTDNYISTCGSDFKYKTISIDDVLIKVQIWDTAGAERFKALSTAYYRHITGAFLIYDITNRQSFENVYDWNIELDRHAPEWCRTILIGNKLDLEENKKIKHDEARKLANKFDIKHSIEVSAKTGQNVQKSVELLLKEMVIVHKVAEQRIQQPFWDKIFTHLD